MDNTKVKQVLAKRIENADLLPDDKDLLQKRLSVASHEGIAAIVRDFDTLMFKRRQLLLQSHRRYAQGLHGRDKLGVTLNIT